MRTKSERIKRFGIVCKDEHLTVQSHKDQADINRVLDRAKHGASLSHLLNYGGRYGDFSDFDSNTFEDMQNRLSEARTIFYDLPAELRSEFGNDPGAFFSFVNNPENKDRLEEIFPALAQPGRQFPDVIGGAAAEAAVAAVQELTAQPGSDDPQDPASASSEGPGSGDSPPASA